MDKSTLSNYGWVVIAVLVLAVMIALATPFGTYIKSGVESTTAGLFDTSEKAMNVVGMSAGNGSFESGSGSSTPTKDPALNPNGTIPEGATYTKADGTVLNAGDSFPETPQPLDAYRYGDYTYVYSADYYTEPYTAPFDTQFTNSNYNKWLVTIRQETSDNTMYGYMLKKNEYGAILESINGQPITDMTETFYNCHTLTTAPAIPSSVTDMTSTFQGCAALTTAPEIPSSVTYMTNTFMDCTSLTTAPEIPNSVTYMSHTFAYCESLTGTITINANPIQWTQCLYNTKITAVVGDTTMAASILNTKTSYVTNPTA